MMKLNTFASGSSGNCALISHGGVNLLLDAGISMRRVQKSLAAQSLEFRDIHGILVTHEHSDHVSGLKMLTKHHKIPIFTTEKVARGIVRRTPELEGCIMCFSAGDELAFGDVGVRSFRTPHDTPESVGYRFETGGRKLFFATDMGHVTQEIAELAAGCDMAVIEANHDLLMLRTGGYPLFLQQRIMSDNGHLSNDACADFAAMLAESGTQKLVLAHLSRENNTVGAAKRAVGAALSEIRAETDIFVAPAEEMLEVSLDGARSRYA